MDGILVVDKPQEWTSHDVVDFVRNKFGLKKVGHAGTLDPMATGVLIVLIGKYTKSSDSFIADDKEYEGTLTLGAESDTGDARGNIKSTASFLDFTDDEIKSVFNKFLGEIEQTPPMYSAVKVNGRRLYKLARSGVQVERNSRKIFIKYLDITKIAKPEISFKVGCSKGTYIRQLAVDIGKLLGCGAYLSELRRTRSGDFGIGEALNIDSLKAMANSDLDKALSLCKS